MRTFRRFARLLKPAVPRCEDLDVEEITHEQMLQAALFIEAKSIAIQLRGDAELDAKLTLSTLLHAQNGKRKTEILDILDEMNIVALWKSLQILKHLVGDSTDSPPLIVVEHPDFGRVTHILPD